MIFNIADFEDPNDKQGRTYREVNNSKSHSYEVGSLVEIGDGVRLFVAKHSRDCDGTPLYCLSPLKDDYEQVKEGFANSNWLNGIDQDSMRIINSKGVTVYR